MQSGFNTKLVRHFLSAYFGSLLYMDCRMDAGEATGISKALTDAWNLFQEWKKVHRSGAYALQTLSSFVSSLQDENRPPPSILQGVLDEVSTPALEQYITVGQQRDVPKRGWDEVNGVSQAYNDLMQSKLDSERVIKEWEKLVDDTNAQLFTNGSGDTAGLENNTFVLNALFESVEKEVNVMCKICNAVNVDMDPSEMQTFVMVWNLQPFLDENLLQLYSALIEGDGGVE